MQALNQIPIPELIVSAEAASRLRDEAQGLPAHDLDSAQTAILGLLISGALLPLRGYPTRADHLRIGREMRLDSGALWPLPLALEIDAALAERIEPGMDIALRADGQVAAIMSVTDLWLNRGATCLGGRVKGLHPLPGPLPNRLRAQFREAQARRVIAVPEADMAMPEPGDAAWLIQPFVGFDGDCSRHSAIPLADPGGDAGLLLRALIHRNFGATHMLVADRDQAALLRRHQNETEIQPVIG